MKEHATNNLDIFYHDISEKINNKIFNPNQLIFDKSAVLEDNKYLTPIAYAIKSSNHDCFEYKRKNLEDQNKCKLFGEKSLAMLSEVIQLLINEKTNVNLKDKKGRTALMEAISSNSNVQEGYQTILTLLILDESRKKKSKKSISEIKEQVSKLGPLIKNGYINVIILLIKSGANVNIKDKKGKTAIMYALENTDIEALNLLINNNADTDLKKQDTKEAFRIAIARKCIETIRFLINNGAKITKKSLQDAIETNNIEIIKLFMKSKLNLNNIRFYSLSLQKSLYKSNIDSKVLELLIENGLQIDLRLFETIADTPQIAKILIDKTDDKKLLHQFYAIAQSKNDMEVLILLKEVGINFGENTPQVRVGNFFRDVPERFIQNILWGIYKYNILLHLAPLGLSFLKLYLKYIKKIDIADIENINLLSNKKHKIKLKILITQFYNSISFKFDLIKLIKSNSDAQIIKTVLEHRDSKIDVNKIDNKGRTPLMLACRTKNLDLVKLLIEYKADIEATDNDGNTVLNYSLADKDISIFLINKKQQINNHNPKKVVEILNLFTQENPIKYSAHSFEWSKYKSYDNFMNELKQAFKDIEDNLKTYSPNLYTKISKFLFDDTLDDNNTWGVHKINFGWASPELKEWASIEDNKPNGKKAIYFELPLKYQRVVNDKSITTFDNVCDVFKNEIEIRDDDKLIKLFTTLEDEYLEEFNVEYINLEGISFYTDVENFRNALIKIFEQFKAKGREQYDDIIVEAIPNETNHYIDIKIIQKESKSTISSQNMKKEIESGDFAMIKDYLTSLCDWYIEATFTDGHHRIEYLSIDSDKVEPEPIPEPIGFTYILRFYK